MAKILVVDDSETVRVQIRKDLEPAGFLVVEAADGLMGIDKAREEKPDLILCDLNMPKLDGLSMAKQIKSDSVLSAIPIFMVTTEASPEAKAKAKEIGIRAWIMKPYDSEKLVAGIKKVLNLS